MCGIAGAFNLDGIVVKNLIAMTDIISHRGPDDEGFYFHNLEDNNFNIYGGNSTPEAIYNSNLTYTPKSHHKNASVSAQFGMGHRRLSIIDLSVAGHQV